MTAQIDRLDFIKINNVCSSKNTSKRIKTLTTDWRKYLQNTHLKNYMYLEYIKNFQNPMIRNKQYNLKICVGQNISIDMSPNEIEGWQIDEKVLKHH